MKPMNLALQLFGSLNLHIMVTFVSFINERFHDSLKRQEVVTYWRNDILSFQQGKSVTKHIHPYSHNLGMPLIFYNNKIS